MKKAIKSAIGLAVAAGLFFGGLFAGSNQEPDISWETAIVAGGTNLITAQALLALPSTTLITDSLDNPAIAARIFLKEVDKDGNPLVAVYYEAKAIAVNNLPKTEVDIKEEDEEA
jgi:hypothetical protein